MIKIILIVALSFTFSTSFSQKLEYSKVIIESIGDPIICEVPGTIKIDEKLGRVIFNNEVKNMFVYKLIKKTIVSKDVIIYDLEYKYLDGKIETSELNYNKFYLKAVHTFHGKHPETYFLLDN